MIVTAKDLRFKISLFFNVLSKGEDIIITYRGKPKARLIPFSENNQEKKEDNALFGMWQDRDESVNDIVRSLRKGRNFDL